MVKYKAPLREYEFILREVLGIEKELGSYPEYSEATWDMIEMISEQFAKINEDYWLPSAKEGDEAAARRRLVLPSCTFSAPPPAAA